MRIVATTALILLGAWISLAEAQTVISSYFETDADGWTWPGDEAGTSWQAAGGNPGAYIRFDNNYPVSFGYLLAPPKYLGDWSTSDGVGLIEYDFQVFQTGGYIGSQATGRLVISGPGGTATYNGAYIPPATGWIHVEAPLAEAQWTVDSGAWADILANVTEFRVRVALYTGTWPHEITGVDNVVVSLPGSVAVDDRSWGSVKAAYR